MDSNTIKSKKPSPYPNPNPNHNPASMRVLVRPPPPPQPSPSPSTSPSTSTSTSSSQPTTGVVVVGFISRRGPDISNLLNRIIDADVFGHPNRRRDTPLVFPEEEVVSDEVKEWFNSRNISYHHDHEKNIVFLQASSVVCPAMGASSSDFDFVLDSHDFAHLQAMLFMFTVCHVIVHIQEGSCFDTQILKILRILQSAKHALTPFLRSHNVLPSHSGPSSSSARPTTHATSSKSPSPRRGSSISNRSSFPISAVSGLGLSTALFPGQCTPVTLFAFIDDFSEMVNSSAAVDESVDASLPTQSGLSNLVRPNNSVKGSTSVVMLSRSANKSEGSLLKKLQSSLEAQIRFLIKKCRALASSESSSYIGSRSGGLSGSTPLLTLDAARAVVLLDCSGIRSGTSLDFATTLVEDVLSGKMTSDSFLLESHSQSGIKEDIVMLKEFIFRQADILRGKGGVVNNANSSSAAGVGMVAVAAAAAAASVASGRGKDPANSQRATSVPDLPSLEMWLSSSKLILKGILSGKPGSGPSGNDNDAMRSKLRHKYSVPPLAEGIAGKGADPPDIAMSLLESGKGITRKFSALWCQRTLPIAKEVYLKDLPPCYPTSQHKAHLEKALDSFHSMVKGPCVQESMKKLEKECLSIWKSERQLCDAISLTGKPCMHQKHDRENDGVASNAIDREHNSGFVFLHACACGRSRKLRADPFDIESANIKFNTFPDCENLLPLLQPPIMNDHAPRQPSDWVVVRLGSARYYEPSKGLLQAGFSAREKFLLRWTIVLETDKQPTVSFANALRQGSFIAKEDIKLDPAATETAKKSSRVQAEPGERDTVVEGHPKFPDISKPDQNKISFGRGLPNIPMKKAFSEVVAGSTSSNSAFPPLQLKAPLSFGSGKGVKKNSSKVTIPGHINVSSGDSQRSEKSEQISSGETEISNVATNKMRHIDRNPLHIGGNVVPPNVDDSSNAPGASVIDGGKAMFNPSSRHFVVYFGFEHECPRGHRFILSPDLLNQLGQQYCLPEESLVTPPLENVNRKHRGPVKSAKSDSHSKAPRISNGNATIRQKVSNLEKTTEVLNASTFAVHEMSHLINSTEQTPHDQLKSAADLQQNLHFVNLNDDGPAFSVLNRKLPIYLNCPYCSTSKNKDGQNLKFAGTISQLQRIFVVTPPFPLVIATNPIIQFEGSHQPAINTDHEQQLQFSLGCQLILPPESFVSIRLPFVYSIRVKDKGLHPLKPFEHEPESTAWITQGTALQVICKGSRSD